MNRNNQCRDPIQILLALFFFSIALGILIPEGGEIKQCLTKIVIKN